MNRIYSPSPTVRSSRVPLYQKGLHGLGQYDWGGGGDWAGGDGGGGDWAGGDGGGDGGGYSYYDQAAADAQAASDAYYAALEAQAASEAAAQGDTSFFQPSAAQDLNMDQEMPGTGQTYGELLAAGYTVDDLNTMLSTEVAGTGQTVGDLLALGYSASDVNTMLATPAASRFIPPTPTSAGKSTTSVPSGGASSGGASGSAPKAAATTPTATAQSAPRVSSTPTTSLTSLTSWLTGQTLVKGLPNWVVGAGGLLIGSVLMGDGSRTTIVRHKRS